MPVYIRILKFMILGVDMANGEPINKRIRYSWKKIISDSCKADREG